MASLSQLMGQLVSLTDAEKRFVISNLSNMLIRGEVGNYEPKEITEKRLAYDKKCPHCSDFSCVIKYGVKKGRQRFYCKVGNKTFGETYNTVLFSTKKDIGKWLQFAWYLVRDFSIKKCHEEVNISTRTAFYWRHKILLAISKTINFDQVDGLVEADETYFLESFKGQRKADWKIVGRNPFKRGGVAQKRGLSDEQVCVICSLDRLGHILSDVVGKSRPDISTVAKFFDKRITPTAMICKDSQSSYANFARAHGIQIRQIPSGKHKIGIYHIQQVNSYHSHLKGWMSRFKGVSTKYLNNYLSWFKWLTINKGVRELDKSHQIFSTAYSVGFKIKWSEFTPITLIVA